ncbi:MAG TPA: alpha/beta fold hydrolase [Casimicrobiaceae bacterium]|nr:alpha/beta fold hydrolase [Casimicrobiaceae bacterium]
MSTRDEAMQIAVGDHTIAGTLIVPDTRMPGVLFLHGWGGSQQQYASRAREIAALGCACLTVDLRGHAQTQGQQATVTREDNLHDALAAYDTLAGEAAVDDRRIAVVGSSYGGYLATLLTTLRPVKWLALRAPALYKDTEWNEPKLALRRLQGLETYRRRALDASDNRALRAAADYRGDVLIVESAHDDIIPREVLQNYRHAYTRAHSLTYRKLEGADHGLTDPSCRQAYSTLLVGWITEMIAADRAVDVAAQKRMQDAMKAQASAGA